MQIESDAGGFPKSLKKEIAILVRIYADINRSLTDSDFILNN